MSTRGVDLGDYIVDVHDFPEPGVIFKDITPLLASNEIRQIAMQTMAAPFRDAHVDAVFGVESRGFIFGLGVADALGVGFVPVRKQGKLPREVISADYALEYGTDVLEVHSDAVGPGAKILIVDDVLATGGTAAATVELVNGLGAVAVGLSVLLELCFLDGRSKLDGLDVISQICVR